LQLIDHLGAAALGQSGGEADAGGEGGGAEAPEGGAELDEVALRLRSSSAKEGRIVGDNDAAPKAPAPVNSARAAGAADAVARAGGGAVAATAAVVVRRG